MPLTYLWTRSGVAWTPRVVGVVGVVDVQNLLEYGWDDTGAKLDTSNLLQ